MLIIFLLLLMFLYNLITYSLNADCFRTGRPHFRDAVSGRIQEKTLYKTVLEHLVSSL
jgi:hypothetical protein